MPNNLVRELIDRTQQLANRIDPGWRERTKLALSRALQYWAIRLPWDGLRETEDFLASGGKFLIFPERVASIISITDRTNNNWIRPAENWDTRLTTAYNNEDSGTACEWRSMGVSPISAQPATDTTLEILASASEALEVRVQGLVRDASASGTAMELQPRSEILVMGGTEPTNTTLTYAHVDFVEKEIATTSSIKVRNPLNNQIISFITPEQGRAQLARVEFRPVPSTATQMRVEYFRKPEEIHSEDQAIDASVDVDFLVWRAAGDLHWILKEQTAARGAWAKADEILGARISAQEERSQQGRIVEPLFTYNELEWEAGERSNTWGVP